MVMLSCVSWIVDELAVKAYILRFARLENLSNVDLIENKTILLKEFLLMCDRIDTNSVLTLHN